MNKKYDFIITEFTEDTVIISLNRPNQGNAFHIEMIRELSEILDFIEQQEDIRFIVFKSVGKYFCLGADLNWMKGAAKLISTENYNECFELVSLFERLACSEKILIAQVQGHCFGGGIGITSACDYVIASDKAKFAFGEVKLGLVPATIMPLVIRKLGVSKAQQLMLTGKEIYPGEALACGLIDIISPADSVEKDVEDLLTVLRSVNKNAQKQIKKLARKIFSDLYSDEIKKYTAKLLADCRVSEEGSEGIQAFLEKRTPNWQENVH